MFKGVGQLARKIARCSHLLQSGRTSTSFDHEIKAEVAEHFRHVEVVELPEMAEACRRKSEGILRRSRPAQDLIEVMEEMIMDAFNGDWDAEERITHYCVKDRCSLGCDGNRQHALERCQDRAVLAVGGTIGEPLEYRWKDMENARAHGKLFR